MRRCLLPLLLCAPAAFGYVRGISGGDSPVPLARVDNAGIQFFLNNTVTAGRQSSASGRAVTVIASDSDPAAAARAAMATWNASGADVKFLPLQTTTAGISANDFQMTIAIAEDADSISAVGAAVAVTLSYSSGGPANLVNGQLVGCSANCTYQLGSIIDSDILLNPAISFSTTGSTNTDFQSVLTHELGHALGANHSSLLGATMYPYTLPNTKNVWRGLSSDDLAFVNAVYNAGAAQGTLTGTVTVAGAPAPYALLTMIDTAAGTTLNALTDATGRYSVQGPPGSYLIYAEPFNAFVQAGNFKLTTLQAAAALTFQATFLGGNASPTPVSLSAGGTATANIAASAGSTGLSVIFGGFGGAGKSGDISSLNGINGPLLLASGQSIDLALIGKGLDSTLTDANIRVYGKGVTVRAGSVRVDTKENFSAGPVVRATLDIAATANLTLGTIFISKGADALPLSGVFVITPAAPAISTGGVVPIFSTSTSIQPGSWISIFGNNLAGGTTVWNGDFPTSLGGVTVTIDGRAAYIWFVSPTQINVQVPDDPNPPGTINVTVTNAGGSSTATATLAAASPSWSLLDSTHVAGIILRNDRSGAYGGGTYDIIGPTGSSLGYATKAVKAGDVVELFGVGFGATNPAVPAGAAFSGAAATANPVSVRINGTAVTPSFAGLTGAGLFQINLTIPAGLPSGDQPLSATVAGATTPTSVVISAQ